MFRLKIDRKNIFILLLLIVLSLPSIFSLLNRGFFQSDDGEWMVIRFSAFFQAFRDGQFPVRFLGRLNNGYGYPVANFLYPGFMYLGIPIHVLGFGFASVIKIIFGMSLVGSVLFTYLWLSRIFNKYSAFVGSLFYLFTPYHLFDLYKRGSIGEILALAVLPFILWQIERKSLFWISIGISFLILSHNTLALLFLPLIIVYTIIVRASDSESRTKKFKYRHFFSILFGLGLSSFFWVPAIFELSYTRFSQVQVSDFRNYFADLNLIGISSLFVLALSTFFFYKVQPWKRLNLHANLHEKLFLFFFAASILSIFFSSQVSISFWNFLPSSFIQFPFRLLSYLILSISFLTAYIVFQFQQDLTNYSSREVSPKGGRIEKFSQISSRPASQQGGQARTITISIILIAVLFISSFKYLKPSEFFDKPEGFYSTNEGTTTVKDEYLPKWVKQKPTEHFKEKVEIDNIHSEISNLSYNSKKVSFNINSQNNAKVRINTIYYPGWKAYLDGVQLDIQYDNPQGVMELSVPKGNHNVNLSFSETPLRLFADILSLLSFIILAVLAYSYNKNHK